MEFGVELGVEFGVESGESQGRIRDHKMGSYLAIGEELVDELDIRVD